jgi:alkane 1-monooxygenase
VHNRSWRDRKRWLWLLALTMPALPFIAVGMHAATDWAVWLWIGPIVILGVVPLVDWVTGIDPVNPPDSVIAELERDRYYRWITFLFLPVQYAGFVLAMWVIARGDLDTPERIGLAVTVGFIGGLGINTAHELGHKKESHERWLSKIALAQSAYGHFYIEHNRGHHVRVATPDDPASARLGESLYRFLPRTILGSIASAWSLERRRYGRRKSHPIHLGNDVLNAWLMTLALWVALVLWLGPVVLPYLLIQAAMAIALLEAVNYLEHYGMLRQVVGVPGKERYERVEARHSWNSNHITTNVLLYHLQRHSDHHAHPTRRYQALRDADDAPSLPTGYAGMILLALVPPLWRRVMDPLVVAHYGSDIRLANIAPRARAHYLRRYPPAVAASAAAMGTTQLGSEPTPLARVMVCPGCDYRYDEVLGDTREGFPPGTAWSAVPESWCCPDCGVRDRSDFIPLGSAAR